MFRNVGLCHRSLQGGRLKITFEIHLWSGLSNTGSGKDRIYGSATFSACSSETLSSEVIATKNTVFKVMSHREQVSVGAKG